MMKSVWEDRPRKGLGSPGAAGHLRRQRASAFCLLLALVLGLLNVTGPVAELLAEELAAEEVPSESAAAESAAAESAAVTATAAATPIARPATAEAPAEAAPADESTPDADGADAEPDKDPQPDGEEPDGALEVIDRLEIILNLPNSGMTPAPGLQLSPKESGRLELLDGGQWFDDAGKALAEKTKFQRGKSYTYRVGIRALKPFILASPEAVTITDQSRKTPPSVSNLGLIYEEGEGGEGGGTYELSYTILIRDSIEAFSLHGFRYPRIGEKPLWGYHVSEEMPFVSGDTSGDPANPRGHWYKQKDDGVLAELQENETFEPGVPYRFLVRLSAKHGYRFVDEPRVTIVEETGATNPTVIESGDRFQTAYKDGTLVLNFPALYNTIDTIPLHMSTGVVPGQRPIPDYRLKKNPSITYADETLGKGKWLVEDGDQFQAMKPDQTFEAGKRYAIDIKVKPKQPSRDRFSRTPELEFFGDVLTQELEQHSFFQDPSDPSVLGIRLVFKPVGTAPSPKPDEPGEAFPGPKGLRAQTLSDGSIRLSWQKSQEAQYYAVFYLGTSGRECHYLLATQQTSFVHKPQERDAVHFYTIRSMKQDGFKDEAQTKPRWSLSGKPDPLFAFAANPVGAPPSRVEDLLAMPTADGAVRLSWKPSRNADAYAIYDLGRDGKSKTLKKIVGETSWIDREVESRKAQYYCVFALRELKDGRYQYSEISLPQFVFAIPN